MPFDPATVASVLDLAHAVRKGGKQAWRWVTHAQPEYGPFWKAFSDAVRRESRDLPWSEIATWRLDPTFIHAACLLMRGNHEGLDLIRARLVDVCTRLPTGSRYAPDEARRELESFVRQSVMAAMKDWPGLRELSNALLLESKVDAVLSAIANYPGPSSSSALDIDAVLSRAYIDPWQVFERVQLDRFVGREWLERSLDDFLTSHDRGYFVVEGAAGLGKTTFLAHLVQSRGWIHHFVERAPGPGGAAAARRSLVSQLVRRVTLATTDIPSLLDEVGDRPARFADVLREAAASRGLSSKIVVVIDGLDEAPDHPGENVLGLPDVLPAGVFFVVSKRDISLSLHVETPRRVITIDPAGAENMADARRFLRRVAQSSCVQATLRAHGVSMSDFVETLGARSGGIWIYLHYVIADLERGAAVDFAALPQGLWAYYARSLRQWERARKETWRTELAMLATLGAVRTGVTEELLATLAGVGPTSIPQAWFPFLVSDDARPPRFWLYHETFRDFLTGEGVDKADRLSDEFVLATRLRQETRAAQERIVNRYLSCWGGLENGLPGLRDPALRDLDGRYGLRSLMFHLAAVSTEQANELMRLETAAPTDGQVANTWALAQETADERAGYLRDVALAWERVGESSQQVLRGGQLAPSVADEYGYALITTSLKSHAARIPVVLRRRFLQHGILSPVAAIDDAASLPKNERVPALLELATALPTAELARMREIAISTARDLPDQLERARALLEVAVAQPLDEQDVLFREVDSLVRAIADPRRRTFGLASLAWALRRAAGVTGQDVPTAALQTARSITDPLSRASTLVMVADLLPESEQGPIRDEIASATLLSQDTIEVSKVLSSAARLGSEEGLSGVVDAAAQLDDSYWASTVLREVASRMRSGPHDELLDVTRRNSYLPQVVRVLVLVAAKLGAPGRDALVAEALHVARQIEGRPSEKVVALAAVASLTRSPAHEAVIREAVDIARTLDRGSRYGALLGVAQQTKDSHARLQLFDEAIDAAPWNHAHARYRLLAQLAKQVPPSLLPRIVERANDIADEGSSAHVLAAVARRHRRGRERDALVLRVLDLARSVQSPRARSSLLATVEDLVPDRYLRRALDSAYSPTDRDIAVGTLIEICSRLAGASRERVFSAALRQSHGISDPAVRATAVARLAELTNGRRRTSLFEDARNLALACKDPSEGARVLADVASRAPRGEMRQTILMDAMASARKCRDQNAAPWFGLIEPLFSGGLLDASLDAVEALPDDLQDRGLLQERGLLAIAGRLPDRLRAQALAIARGIVPPGRRAFVLVRLHQEWESAPPHLLSEALGLLTQESSSYLRARALEAMLPRIPPDLIEQALQMLATVGNEYARARLLENFRAILPQELRPRVIASLDEFHDARAYVRAATSAASMTEGEHRLALLREALRRAQDIESRSWRVEALVELSRVWTEQRDRILAEAGNTIDGIYHDDYRWIEAVALLSREYEGPERELLLVKILEKAQAMPWESNKGPAFGDVLFELPEERLDEALLAAVSSVWALPKVVRRLHPPQLSRALELVARLPAENTPGKLDALAAIANEAATRSRGNYTLWTSILRLYASESRADLLRASSLLDFVSTLGGSAALVCASDWIVDACRWWR